MATMGCSLMCSDAVIVERERAKENEKKEGKTGGGAVLFLCCGCWLLIVVVLYTHNIVTNMYQGVACGWEKI